MGSNGFRVLLGFSSSILKQLIFIWYLQCARNCKFTHALVIRFSLQSQEVEAVPPSPEFTRARRHRGLGAWRERVPGTQSRSVSPGAWSLRSLRSERQAVLRPAVTQACPLFTTPWPAAQQAPLPADSPGKKAGVGCRVLLQRITPTQGSNPGLPHCGRILRLCAPGSASLGSLGLASLLPAAQLLPAAVDGPARSRPPCCFGSHHVLSVTV